MGGAVPTVSTRLWWRGPGEGSSWGQVRRVGCPGAGGGVPDAGSGNPSSAPANWGGLSLPPLPGPAGLLRPQTS